MSPSVPHTSTVTIRSILGETSPWNTKMLMSSYFCFVKNRHNETKPATRHKHKFGTRDPGEKTQWQLITVVRPLTHLEPTPADAARQNYWQILYYTWKPNQSELTLSSPAPQNSLSSSSSSHLLPPTSTHHVLAYPTIPPQHTTSTRPPTHLAVLGDTSSRVPIPAFDSGSSVQAKGVTIGV